MRALWQGLTFNGIVAWGIVPRGLRWRLLRLLGMDIAHSAISPGVWFGSARVTIGQGTFVNRECMFSTHERITLGSNVDVGMRVTFITATHEVGPPSRRAGLHKTAPITVGDGAWIGAGVIILPGVMVGAGAIIAAGAVVTSDCMPNRVYGGVPARELRSLD